MREEQDSADWWKETPRHPALLRWASDDVPSWLTRERLWTLYQTYMAVDKAMRPRTPVQEASFMERFDHQLVLRGFWRITAEGEVYLPEFGPLGPRA